MTQPNTGFYAPTQFKSLSPALNNLLRSRKVSDTYSTSIADPYTDLQWGYDYLSSKAPHTYFDYYFTGQDVSIYMEGTMREGQTMQQVAMPIVEFGCGIQQQKQPVYGFWSWNYDAVMRGTRVVNGMFRIVTTYTDYMADMISDSVNNRFNGPTAVPVRGLDIDESMIQTYWSRNFNDESTSSIGGRNVFSSHPPFNFIVQYGLQSPSLYNTQLNTLDYYDNYQEDDTPLMTDINERLVDADPSGKMQYRIEDVELTGMQTEYNVDGQVCSEVYTFFARDMYSPV